jgi:hypothetical protein
MIELTITFGSTKAMIVSPFDERAALGRVVSNLFLRHAELAELLATQPLCHLGPETTAHLSLRQIEIVVVQKDGVERCQEGSDGYREIQMYTPPRTTRNRRATNFTDGRIPTVEDFSVKRSGGDLALHDCRRMKASNESS